MEEGRCERERQEMSAFFGSGRSRPLGPSSVSLARASSPGGEAFSVGEG